MSEENIIYIKKENIKKSEIPSYQRGYKWEAKNIEDLLNDIDSINNEDKRDHCLHNLTIIEKNNEWEIIDGQQRLTTIFLILKYLGKEYYSLSYKIREETECFLNSEINKIIIDLKNDKYKDKKEKDLFGDIKSKNKDYNKQDIYYICQALFTIHNWFNKNYKDKSVDIEEFTKKLENVYFYKHEIKTNITSEAVFSNLNSGRVPLTNIELIKADLIINISENEMKTEENKSEILINEIRSNIGRLWDEMESWFAQDEVWYWIAPKNKSVNKLSLLFNMCSELKENKNINYKDIYEKYYDYVYDGNSKCDYSKKVEKIWNKIKNYYYTIKDWYLDNDMYHLIGIMVSFGIEINEFIENNSDIKNKNELKIKLKNKIIELLKLTNENNELKLGNRDYLDLNFEEDKTSINKIFILLNCLEGYNNNKFNEYFRYRFDIHNKYNWSIEHIIPQNPTKETISAYFNDMILYFINRDEIEEKDLEKINKKIIDNFNLSETEYNYNDKKELAKKLVFSLENNKDNKLKEKLIEEIKKEFPNFDDFIDIHNIGNLALLDGNTNSILKNNIFKKKRNLLEFIKNNEGKFIPPLTLKAFSKTFGSDDIEKSYWTPEDFNKYEEYQAEKLKNFIKSIK